MVQSIHLPFDLIRVSILHQMLVIIMGKSEFSFFLPFFNLILF